MTSKKYFIVLVVGTLAGLLAFSMPAKAEPVNLTPGQTEYVRSVCSSTETSLIQLHTNDALLRVNVGQSYESISTRLIKRFNSRVAFNNLNNSSLLTVTSEYDKSLDLFRNAYRDYETSLSSLSEMDCQNEPANFFSLLESTRAKRLNVRNSIISMNTHLQKYSSEVLNFETNYRTVAGQDGS